MGNVTAPLTSCATGGALSYPYTRPEDDEAISKKKKKTTPTTSTEFPDLLLLPPPHHRTFKRKPLTLSLKKLPALIVGTLSRRNKNNNNKEYYTLPPNAETPSSPSSPEVFQDQDEYFVLRWDPPAYDGGIPIIGYVIQHVELGLPPLREDNNRSPTPQHPHHQNNESDECELWYSSDPGEITSTECILNNLVPGTTYQFRVVAENLLGFSPPSDPSPPIVFNPHNDLDDWFTMPEFSAILDDYHNVLEHETVTLSVEVRGQPYPIVRWYDAKDIEIKNGGSAARFRLRAQGFTRSLTINSVALGDAGVFRCVASNSQGEVQCETNVVVEAPPRIKRIPHGDLLQSPYDLTEREMAEIEESTTSSSRGPSPNQHPSFRLQEDPPEDEVILAAGELLRVKYAYAGEPRPEVTVFHDHQEDYEGRAAVDMSERVLTLKVECVTREDRGEWVVRLENALGEDATPPLIVTVTDHPSCPGRPELLQLPDNTCILKWAEPHDDGGCPIHNYLVEYYRFEWGVWLKALTTRVGHARVKDLIPGSKYKFRVKAENLYGCSKASEESVDILITDTPSARYTNNHDGLMRTLDENEEEDEDDEDTTAMSLEEFIQEESAAAAAATPTPTSPQIVLPKLSPRLLPRSSLIKSNEAVVPPKSPINQLSVPSAAAGGRLRLLAQLSGESRLSSMDDEDFSEVDFEKLQAEYEEEMRGVAELDEQEDEDEFLRIKKRWEEENRDVFNRANSREPDSVDSIRKEKEGDDEEDVEYADLDWSHWRNKLGKPSGGDKEEEDAGAAAAEEEQHAAEEEPAAAASEEPEEQPSEEEEEEEPEYIPQYRVGASRFTSAAASPPTLPDRFTDYLTMKVASRDGRIASSMRSLTQNSSQTSLNKTSRETSRENIRKLFMGSNGQDDEDEEVTLRRPVTTSFAASQQQQRWSRGSAERTNAPPTSSSATSAPSKPVQPTSTTAAAAAEESPAATATAAAAPSPVEVQARPLTPLLILSCLLLPPTLYVDVYLSLVTLLLLLVWNKYVR